MPTEETTWEHLSEMEGEKEDDVDYYRAMTKAFELLFEACKGNPNESTERKSI